jgi:hypothetical protein
LAYSKRSVLPIGRRDQNRALAIGVSSLDIQRARRIAKRIRSSAACKSCKASKAKCSDFRPCARCAKSKAECTDKAAGEGQHDASNAAGKAPSEGQGDAIINQASSFMIQDIPAIPNFLPWTTPAADRELATNNNTPISSVSTGPANLVYHLLQAQGHIGLRMIHQPILSAESPFSGTPSLLLLQVLSAASRALPQPHLHDLNRLRYNMGSLHSSPFSFP